jgi:hypothetical protein
VGCVGIDADLVMKVTSIPASDPTCEGVLAGAAAVYVESGSLRPIYGVMILCNFDPNNFSNDLTTTVHETLHVLVRFLSLN